MYQILALNCLISAYSLSVLYLDGIKYGMGNWKLVIDKQGDSQMMAEGVLMTIAYLALSNATPLTELSPIRPLTSIFHPSLFLSLLGQFAIHLGTMIYATSYTKQYMPGMCSHCGSLSLSRLGTESRRQVWAISIEHCRILGIYRAISLGIRG